MIKVLIKSARIVDKQSSFHNHVMDVLINNGTIEKIEPEINDDEAEVINENGLYLSPGWIDMRVNFGDPGFEYREDLISGSLAAAKGGIIAVGLLPDTNPRVTAKSDILYLKSKNSNSPVEILPLASLSKEDEEEELSEMIDLHTAGASAFTNGDRLLSNGLLKRALFYTNSFEGLTIVQALEDERTEENSVNEGTASVQMGLPGSAIVNEELTISRNIELCRYTGARLHISKITSAKGVELIKNAKEEGLPITADVCIYHLMFEDNDMMDFNTQLKFFPPLRSTTDRQALKEGVISGIIDAIVSDHTPLEEDLKKDVFSSAYFGAIGTQILFPLIQEVFGTDTFLDNVIGAITEKPAYILRKSLPKIEVGQSASLTLFNPDKEWIFDANHNASKSSNSPFYNKKLKGKAVAVFNKAQFLKL